MHPVGFTKFKNIVVYISFFILFYLILFHAFLRITQTNFVVLSTIYLNGKVYKPNALSRYL